MDKLKLLKIILRVGALFFIVGAIAHYFDLTIFPWYDAKLYTPYHDIIIALSAVVLALFLLVVANDPIKNIDTLNVVIAGAILAAIVSIAVVWKVNFVRLGAPGKIPQTITEGILGFIFAGALLWLHPKKNKNLKAPL